MVSSVIIGILVPALGLALLTFLKVAGGVSVQYSDSQEAQFSALHFAADAGSASKVRPTVADIGAVTDPCATGTVAVEMYWRDSSSPAIDHLVAYTTVGTSFHRLVCTKAASAG